MAEKGLYLYGIINRVQAAQLGDIGLDQNPVYTLPSKDCSLVVHSCAPQAYTSHDQEQVKTWVKSHQQTVESASTLASVIIPLSFNVIINGSDPEKSATEWVEQEYDRLQALFKKLENKKEFGVQVLWDKTILMEKIRNQGQFQELENASATTTPGKAYFHRQELDQKLHQTIERQADAWFKQFYQNIKTHAEEVKVERLRKGEPMLMNLSCLIRHEKVKEMGKALDEIQNMEGFSVRFTGPWPPYSFVV